MVGNIYIFFQIDPDEFRNVFQRSQTHFPDSPIIWLKELVQFLNQKMPHEIQDPVFTKKNEGYPLNMVISHFIFTLHFS